MPDLVTHLASGYVADAAFRPRQPFRLAFLLGVLLPDLLTRPFFIIWPQTYEFVRPLHAPFTYVIACWMLTQLFAYRRQRSVIFTGLFLGGLLHFAADALQQQFLKPYLWLFPVCRCETSWGLFGPEASLEFLPVTLLLTVIFCWMAGRAA